MDALDTLEMMLVGGWEGNMCFGNSREGSEVERGGGRERVYPLRGGRHKVPLKN